MPSPIDLWLIAALGFLGSFGHCVGMCGPLTAAFALSAQASPKLASPTAKGTGSVRSQLVFHLWLNLGRLLSYALVGAAIGALGSVIFAGGQMAGVGSALRRGIALLTGSLLIWFGLCHALPGQVPTVPLLHPARQQRLHGAIHRALQTVSRMANPSALLAASQAAPPEAASQASGVAILSAFTPMVLGLLWGLIPCGFLYAAQLRAAETQSWLGGTAIMMAFGLGTLPAMVAMGVTTSLLSQDRRSQLFRLGGWLTVIIGSLLLLRTGDVMVDYSGHGALVALSLALVARPISRLWPGLLRYRRLLGVAAFVLGSLHTLHKVSHTWNWQLGAIAFMLKQHQVGVWLGIIALLLLAPAALTSFDRAQKALGSHWRRLHLLAVPALVLAAAHTLLIGASYWGPLAIGWPNHLRAAGLVGLVGAVLAVRSQRLWSFFALETFYAPPQSHPRPHPSTAAGKPAGSAQADAAEASFLEAPEAPPDPNSSGCCQSATSPLESTSEPASQLIPSDSP